MVVILGVAEAVIVSTAFISCRHVLGYAYSNDKEVIDYVAEMAPLLCVSVTADSLIGALSGIARGGGFQEIGAYVNLGAYYLVGIPMGLLLGFHLQLRAKGLARDCGPLQKLQQQNHKVEIYMCKKTKKKKILFTFY